MVILVTGANGQLGNEMRIISNGSSDKYIFTDVNQIEGLETIYLDITDLDAIRKMVSENSVDAIVNCAAWTNVDGAEDPDKYDLVEKLNATAPENLAEIEYEVSHGKSSPPNHHHLPTGHDRTWLYGIASRDGGRQIWRIHRKRKNPAACLRLNGVRRRAKRCCPPVSGGK